MAGIARFRIEAASRSQWTAIAALQETCFPDDPTHIDEAEFCALLEGNGGSVTVARLGECVAGYTVIRRKTFFPWESVAFVAVDRDYRGNGLGTALTAAAADASRRPFLRLHVRPSNMPALNIYRNLGFRVIGRRANCYCDGEVALVMMSWPGPKFLRKSHENSRLFRHRPAT